MAINSEMSGKWQVEVKAPLKSSEEMDVTSSEEMDVTAVVASSPVLTRLVEEVRNEQLNEPHGVYNRMHNRHNRSR